MLFKINSLAVAALAVLTILVSVEGSYASDRTPLIVGKSSIVSKRVYIGRTFSRANSHKIRLEAIRSRLHK